MENKTKIKKLSEEVIALIAAGQVIERPANVIKELTENAIDAKATQIEINVEDYGLGKISVSDNGTGMTKDNLLLSFLPHTTSKISSTDDLIAIKTLGFRGEALASIANVSELSIKSRQIKENSGYEIKIERLKVLEENPTGIPTGTQVIVENLFSKVPARKKFLKEKQTELKKLLIVCEDLALANPKVGINLFHEGKLLLSTKPESEKERLTSIFGEYTSDLMLPVHLSEPYIAISGYISTPQISYSNSGKARIFVNGRRIQDTLILHAIKEGYGSLLEARNYPTAVLFIKVPTALVDVNVHPTKSEIRFIQPNEVFQFVKQAIQETLLKNNLTFHNLSFSKDHFSSSLSEIISKTSIAQIGKIDENSPILQIHQTYLITQTKNGLLIIDQHAAHESILYEEFKKAFDKKESEGASVDCEPPVLLELTPSEDEQLTEQLNSFNKLGFEITEFGKHTYKINKIPKVLEGLSIKNVFSELLSNEVDQIKFKKLQNKMLATLACKAAIKAGDKLEEKDKRELINVLSDYPQSYTCPHGRPVKIEISLKMLNRMFKRE